VSSRPRDERNLQTGFRVASDARCKFVDILQAITGRFPDRQRKGDRRSE
jgi:hypothetical protein